MSPARARDASDRMAMEAAVFSSAASAATPAGSSASAAGRGRTAARADVTRAVMSAWQPADRRCAAAGRPPGCPAGGWVRSSWCLVSWMCARAGLSSLAQRIQPYNGGGMAHTITLIPATHRPRSRGGRHPDSHGLGRRDRVGAHDAGWWRSSATAPRCPTRSSTPSERNEVGLKGPLTTPIGSGSRASTWACAGTGPLRKPPAGLQSGGRQDAVREGRPGARAREHPRTSTPASSTRWCRRWRA